MAREVDLGSIIGPQGETGPTGRKEIPERKVIKGIPERLEQQEKMVSLHLSKFEAVI